MKEYTTIVDYNVRHNVNNNFSVNIENNVGRNVRTIIWRNIGRPVMNNHKLFQYNSLRQYKDTL